MIYSSPLAFSSLEDEKLIAIANSYLPYSTGIEIECSLLNSDLPGFLGSHIKDLIQESHDSTEKRFRIPAGIKGMICLFKISEWLKENCGLNEKSGIHYHIDMGSSFYDENPDYQYALNTEWILKALDKWEYKGRYNSRKVGESKGYWVAFRSAMNTMEFRIGEMTFDYELLIKRIINCQNIVRKYKKQFVKPVTKKEIKRKTFSTIFDPW